MKHPSPVIVTRPAAQAAPLLAQLAASGRLVEFFPLLEIHALNNFDALDAILARLSDFALVAFVSPNAIDAVFARLQKWPAGLAIAVMGAGSRAALAAHGINDANTRIISPGNPLRTDSETLLEELDLEKLRMEQVLIVRGETGRELLADALRAREVAVTQIAAYRRAAPELTKQIRQTLSGFLQRENTWVITSSEALRTLTDWVHGLDLENAVAKMQQQHIVVPHARIAEVAKILGFQSITLTGSGDEQLLVALQSHP